MPYKDPEKKKARDKAYHAARLAANPAKVRAEQKAARQRYFAKHTDKVRAIWRKYRLEHPEKVRATKAKYRTANQEKEHASRKAYNLIHKEYNKKYAAAYYASHVEQYSKRYRTYSIAHPEIIRSKEERRRASKANATINDFTAKQWKEMQEVYNHRCAYCEKRAKGHLTKDHITPLSQGGSHTASNIIPSCRPCNLKKYTGPPLCPVQPLLLTVAQ